MALWYQTMGPKCECCLKVTYWPYAFVKGAGLVCVYCFNRYFTHTAWEIVKGRTPPDQRRNHEAVCPETVN